MSAPELGPLTVTLRRPVDHARRALSEDEIVRVQAAIALALELPPGTVTVHDDASTPHDLAQAIFRWAEKHHDSDDCTVEWSSDVHRGEMGVWVDATVWTPYQQLPPLWGPERWRREAQDAGVWASVPEGGEPDALTGTVLLRRGDDVLQLECGDDQVQVSPLHLNEAELTRLTVLDASGGSRHWTPIFTDNVGNGEPRVYDSHEFMSSPRGHP